MSILCEECPVVPHVTMHNTETCNSEVLRDLFVSQMRGYIVRRLYSERQELSAEVVALEGLAKEYRSVINHPKVKQRRLYRRIVAEEKEQIALRRVKLAETAARREAELRRGLVYVLKTFAGLYKIGKTRDIKKRLAGYAIIGNDAFECLHTIPCEDCHGAEQMLHERFKEKRIDRRELFDLSGEEVEWLLSVSAISPAGIERKG